MLRLRDHTKPTSGIYEWTLAVLARCCSQRVMKNFARTIKRGVGQSALRGRSSKDFLVRESFSTESVTCAVLTKASAVIDF